MSRIVQTLFLIAFFVSGTLGYSYFGPASHTRFFMKQGWYRDHVLPVFDGIFSMNGESSQLVGYLSTAQGDLSVRAPSELVFIPGRDGQALYAGTLVSAGESSSAKITLVDNSLLSLEASSTILLDVPETATSERSITLKVIKGTVAADKEDSSNTNVQIVTSKGVLRSVDAGKKTVVMSQRKSELSEGALSKSAKISQLLRKEQEEFEELVGTIKDDTNVKDLKTKLFSDRSVISSRVRAASQKVNSATPEKDLDLEKLAQLTDELEKEFALNETNEKVSKENESDLKKSLTPDSPQVIPAKIASQKRANDLISAISPELLDELNKAEKLESEEALAAEKAALEAAKLKNSSVPAAPLGVVPARVSSKSKSSTGAALASDAVDSIQEGEKAAALATKIYSPEMDFSPEILKQAEALAASSLGKPVDPIDRIPAAQVEPEEDLKDKAVIAKKVAQEEIYESSLLEKAKDSAKKEKKLLTLNDALGLRGRSLTNYGSTGFSPANQLAMDGLMGNFLAAEKCPSAYGTLARVKRSYGQDLRAKNWIAKWKPIYESSCEDEEESE